MTLGSRTNEQGRQEFVLHLTGQEIEDFKAGKPVVKESGDAQGDFTITVQLTRPTVTEKHLLTIADDRADYFVTGFNNTTAYPTLSNFQSEALQFDSDADARAWAAKYLPGYTFKVRTRLVSNR